MNKDKGTVYAVVGNSGKHEPDNRGKMYPAMYKKYSADKGVGSMILDVRGNTLTASYFKDNGELFDKFRIVKVDSAILSGIRNNSTIIDLKIYPNPFSNNVMVEFFAREKQADRYYHSKYRRTTSSGNHMDRQQPDGQQ